MNDWLRTYCAVAFPLSILFGTTIRIADVDAPPIWAIVSGLTAASIAYGWAATLRREKREQPR